MVYDLTRERYYRTRPKRRINKYKFEIRFLKEISRSLNPLRSHSGAETMKIEISSSVILLECLKIQNSGKPIYDRMRKWNFWLYFWRPKELIRSKVMEGTLKKNQIILKLTIFRFKILPRDWSSCDIFSKTVLHVRLRLTFREINVEVIKMSILTHVKVRMGTRNVMWMLKSGILFTFDMVKLNWKPHAVLFWAKLL